MFRLAIFIIALLLLSGAVDPTRVWLIALTVIAGLQLIRFRVRPWRVFDAPSLRWPRGGGFHRWMDW